MTTDERETRAGFLARWRGSQLAEVAWRAHAGVPDAAAVVPLVDDGAPALALPYAQLELARALDAAAEVVLAVAAPLGDAEVAVLGRADVEVDEDPEGVAFEARGLLLQTLAKHPPDRRRLDSLLLRREHWWYVPRLLVRFTGLRAVRRSPTGDALLVLGGGDLDVIPCSLAGREPLHLAPVTPVTADVSRPALVLEHGADLPDLERPWQRRWRGVQAPSGFEVDGASGAGPSEHPLTLRERLRVERRLARNCRRGLRAAGH